MYAEVAWVIVSSRTRVQPQIILDPDYLSDYPSVSYDYGVMKWSIRFTWIKSSTVMYNNLQLSNYEFNYPKKLFQIVFGKRKETWSNIISNRLLLMKKQCNSEITDTWTNAEN